MDVRKLETAAAKIEYPYEKSRNIAPIAISAVAVTTGTYPTNNGNETKIIHFLMRINVHSDLWNNDDVPLAVRGLTAAGKGFFV